MVVTPNKPEGILEEDINMSEKIKMDKVRRLLANRYGEEGRVAVMNALGKLNVHNSIFDGVDPVEAELAMKSILDLSTRANREPKVVEVADKEVVAE